LCMQIIATAGKEQEMHGRSILDRECEFRRLIAIFAELNNVVSRQFYGRTTTEDKIFLEQNEISDIALEVAHVICKDSKR